MNVYYAFVNADLEDDVEIWCHIPLNKALYHLKQTARQRNIDFNTYILAMGFVRLVSDS